MATSLEALLGREKTSNVSFGTTLDRPLFPAKVPPTRVGVILQAESSPNRAPGTYDNHEVSGFVYHINNQVTSKRGYSLGARTGPRFRKEFMEKTPCPSAYQTDVTQPMTSTTAYKPFEAGALRFPKIQKDPDLTPGPGTYEHNVKRNRKVGFHGTFGGPQLLKIPPDGGYLLPEDCKGTTYKSRMMSYKDLRKFKIRESYLSLYWD
ncbi:ciliary microtubule-associated protein 3-like [Saccoglossus kowalevskii]|uniref:Protein pitchfork-like n=1 Tax=Saccoglossus kowalevskii TaxID=10224 RepID=A0ABM0GMY9_SACKO|nr:PREDICTED: protein pitchfork-like [Saccoglossus kowalevskii]